MSGPIDSAVSYETSIELIDAETCQQGMFFLETSLIQLLSEIGDASLIPIKNGGNIVGQALAEKTGLIENPMRMSHTGPDNVYLPEAVCLEEPDLALILGADDVTKPVVFAEAVVESQKTITGAMQKVNQMIDQYNLENGTNYPYPDYYTYALISKIDEQVGIPNLVDAFHVSRLIWVHGMGCDDKSAQGEERGRNKPSIWGRLPDGYTTTPSEPYVEQLFY